MLDAAAQGLGIAFMFEMHLEGARDPRLACRRSALVRRPVRIFHDWLVGGLE